MFHFESEIKLFGSKYDDDGTISLQGLIEEQSLDSREKKRCSFTREACSKAGLSLASGGTNCTSKLRYAKLQYKASKIGCYLYLCIHDLPCQFMEKSHIKGVTLLGCHQFRQATFC